MKDFLLFLVVVAAIVLLTYKNDTPLAVSQEQLDMYKANAKMFIEDSYAEKFGGGDDDDVSKCECNGTRYIIHLDGHRTPCPCGANCTCQKSTGDSK